MYVSTFDLLKKYSEIAHFCTTRLGGASVGNYASSNFSPYVDDNEESVKKNTEALCAVLGINSERLILPFQTHGTEIREIDAHYFDLNAALQQQYLHGVDAIFTRMKQTCIGITTADCVPLLFYCPDHQVVACAHAGWRGTCARIASKTVATLMQKYGCEAEKILVAVGPSISQKVYQVGAEVVSSFEENGFDTQDISTVRDGAIYLDLWKANVQDLVEIGVRRENIEVAGICTYTEHETYFSARRLGLKSGRMLSGIMLKS